jgi:hypothetical protein
VTVMHPFHPYSGQRGVVCGERANRAGRRLLLRFDDGRICAVPPQWTDAVPPDPEVAMGDGRALCTVTDLLVLARFVAAMKARERMIEPDPCNDNNAAPVKLITPHSPWRFR